MLWLFRKRLPRRRRAAARRNVGFSRSAGTVSGATRSSVEGANIVRHHLEMSTHFLSKFRPRFLTRAPHSFALDLRLLVKRFLVGEVLRSRMIQGPSQRLFQSDHASALVPWPSASVSNEASDSPGRGRCRQTRPPFRDHPGSAVAPCSSVVMVHQRTSERRCAAASPAETRRTLGEKRARTRCGRADGATGVVQQQKHLVRTKGSASFRRARFGAELWIFRLHHLVLMRCRRCSSAV